MEAQEGESAILQDQGCQLGSSWLYSWAGAGRGLWGERPMSLLLPQGASQHLTSWGEDPWKPGLKLDERKEGGSKGLA